VGHGPALRPALPEQRFELRRHRAAEEQLDVLRPRHDVPLAVEDRADPVARDSLPREDRNQGRRLDDRGQHVHEHAAPQDGHPDRQVVLPGDRPEREIADDRLLGDQHHLEAPPVGEPHRRLPERSERVHDLPPVGREQDDGQPVGLAREHALDLHVELAEVPAVEAARGGQRLQLADRAAEALVDRVHQGPRGLDRAIPHRRALLAPEGHDHDGGEHHHGHQHREHEQDEMRAKPHASDSRRSGAERQAAGP
jgi:hypothetical protein